MHIGLQVLRAKIRGFQAAGTSIHHRIRKARGQKRNELWHQKRALGRQNRDHLIAYAILRGVPYERIEQCAERNRPDPLVVLDLVRAHGMDSSLTLLSLNNLLLRPSQGSEGRHQQPLKKEE